MLTRALMRVVAVWLVSLAMRFTPDRDTLTLLAFIALSNAMKKDSLE